MLVVNSRELNPNKCHQTLSFFGFLATTTIFLATHAPSMVVSVALVRIITPVIIVYLVILQMLVVADTTFPATRHTPLADTLQFALKGVGEFF